MKPVWRPLLALLLALLFVLTGCSSKSSPMSGDFAVSKPQAAAAESLAPGAGLTEGDLTVDGAPESGRKLIRSSSLQLETLEFDQAVDEINALVLQLGGYMESSYIEGGAHGGSRTASFTCRVPAAAFASANERLAAVGNVVTRSQSAEDVTDQYYEVRYRINDRTSAIKRYDGLVEYAAIQIELTEVVEYQEMPAETFSARVAETFFSSLQFAEEFGQGLVLLIVAVAPFVGIYGGIAALLAGLIVLIVKLCRRKKTR